MRGSLLVVVSPNQLVAWEAADFLSLKREPVWDLKLEGPVVRVGDVRSMLLIGTPTDLWLWREKDDLSRLGSLKAGVSSLGGYCGEKEDLAIFVGYLNGYLEAYDANMKLEWRDHLSTYPEIRQLYALSETRLLLTLRPSETTPRASFIEVVEYKDDHLQVVLAKPGREVREGGHDRYIPGPGTDRMYPWSEDLTVVALADGTIAYIEHDESEWSVRQQWQGSFPVVGGSTVSWDEDKYLAVALRAGTVFLIPSSSTKSIPCFAFPRDDDPEEPLTYPAFQFLPTFTAVTVNTLMYPATTMFFYAWPGGIVDVYAAHLLQPDPEKKVLQELLTDLPNFVEFLLKDESPQWDAVREEVQDLKVPLTLEDLCQRKELPRVLLEMTTRSGADVR